MRVCTHIDAKYIATGCEFHVTARVVPNSFARGCWAWFYQFAIVVQVLQLQIDFRAASLHGNHQEQQRCTCWKRKSDRIPHIYWRSLFQWKCLFVWSKTVEISIVKLQKCLCLFRCKLERKFSGGFPSRCQPLWMDVYDEILTLFCMHLNIFVRE
jgi:hypothetical protein